MRNLEARAPYGERERVVGHGQPAARGVPFGPNTPGKGEFLVLRRIAQHLSSGGNSSPAQKLFYSSCREGP